MGLKNLDKLQDQKIPPFKIHCYTADGKKKTVLDYTNAFVRDIYNKHLYEALKDKSHPCDPNEFFDVWLGEKPGLDNKKLVPPPYGFRGAEPLVGLANMAYSAKKLGGDTVQKYANCMANGQTVNSRTNEQLNICLKSMGTTA